MRREKGEVIRVTFSKEQRALIKSIAGDTYEGEAGFIRRAAVWWADRRTEAPTKKAWLKRQAEALEHHALRAAGLAQCIVSGIRFIPPDKLGSVSKPKRRKRAA
ncbi:MAG TPA: hypothetical protein VFU50_01000 [Terriglobales bacterium]|nr:hypothetical protein [Terriglobales bacterium]